MDRLLDRLCQDITADLSANRLILPSMPDVVVKIWRMAASKKTSCAELARVIAGDPALSARLIRVANSAFFPSAKPVADLKRAVTKLGNTSVKQLVTAFQVARLYDAKRHPLTRPHLTTLWNHSTMVAAISESVAGRLEHLTRETALLAGLIHRIGVMPILLRAEKTPQLIKDPRMLDAVVDSLQAKIGRAVLELWQFPNELKDVAAEHADITREHAGPGDYVDVVQVANLAVCKDTDHPLGHVDWNTVPAVRSTRANPDRADELVRYAGSRVGALRTLLIA